MAINDQNTSLLAAEWHYNTPLCSHQYDDACDVECNACGGMRIPPHIPTTDLAVVPTCTTGGVTEGAHCTVCQAVLVAQESLSAMGHRYGRDNLCDVCGEDEYAAFYSYDIVDGEAILTKVNASVVGKIAVPATLGGYPVTSIGVEAFTFCDGMTEVIIPSSITTVDDWAFSYCTALKTVWFGNGVKRIGENAFCGCRALESISIPDSVTAIGSYAFNECPSLTTLAIGSGVTDIGENVHTERDSLVSVTVDSDNTVYHSAGKCLIHTADKTLILGCNSSEIPADGSVTRIGDHAFFECSALTAITIPLGVESVGWYAFADCKALETVTFANSVKLVEDYAFYGCDTLADVHYDGSELQMAQLTVNPNNQPLTDATWHYVCGCTVTTVVGYVAPTCTVEGNTGDTVCTVCGVTVKSGEPIAAHGHKYTDADDNLCDVCGEDRTLAYYTYTVTNGTATVTAVDPAVGGRVFVPETLGGYTVTAVAARAFTGCTGIRTLTVPATVQQVGAGAFQGCSSLEAVYWNAVDCAAVNGADTPVFADCPALRAVHIGQGVKTVPPYVFSHTPLTAVSVAEGVEHVGEYAFSGCTALSQITLPAGVVSVGEGAFRGCTALADAALPDSVIVIERYAFAFCSALASLSLGNGLSAVGYAAFLGCDGLAMVRYNGTSTERAVIRFAEENTPLTGSQWYTVTTRGDTNGNGRVDSTDARLTLQFAVGKISVLAEPQAADVDGDGHVDSTDARLILQYAVQKITDFPKSE